MIVKIHARHFKGQSFSVEIGQFTLIQGENGTGKSAIAEALTLACMGYLPNDPAKQPSAIYAAYGDGKNEMIVAIENEKVERFARKYAPDKNGGASLKVFMNGQEVPAKQVDRTLIGLGDPKVFDLKAFNDLSEQKQIEYLFSLAPLDAGLNQITARIADAEAEENRLAAEIRGKKMAMEQIAREKANLEVPAGTLPETQARIKDLESQLEQAQADLNALEAQRRADEAAEKAKRDSEDRARRDKEAADARLKAAEEREKKARAEAEASKIREQEANKRAQEAQRELDEAKDTLAETKKVMEISTAPGAFDFEPIPEPEHGNNGCADILNRVLVALEDSGCGDMCVPAMVLRREIRRLEESNV